MQMLAIRNKNPAAGRANVRASPVFRRWLGSHGRSPFLLTREVALDEADVFGGRFEGQGTGAEEAVGASAGESEDTVNLAVDALRVRAGHDAGVHVHAYPHLGMGTGNRFDKGRLVSLDVADEVTGTGREEVVQDRSEEHTSELQSLRHLVCR